MPDKASQRLPGDTVVVDGALLPEPMLVPAPLLELGSVLLPLPGVVVLESVLEPDVPLALESPELPVVWANEAVEMPSSAAATAAPSSFICMVALLYG